MTTSAEAPVNGVKKKPVASFGPYKTGGGSQVEIAVWANEGKDDNAGRVFYGVSFGRSYYDGKDASGNDRFERTQSMRQQDIPALIYGLEQAQAWIFEQRASEKSEKPEEEEDQF